MMMSAEIGSDSLDDGDFGDFQIACPVSKPQQTTTTSVKFASKFDSNTLPISVGAFNEQSSLGNIFDTDWFQFKTILSNFEENLIIIFSLNNVKQDDGDAVGGNGQFEASLSESPKYTIRSHEDIINDCPIWWNLTGSSRTSSPLNFNRSLSFEHFIKSLRLNDNTETNEKANNKLKNNSNIKTKNLCRETENDDEEDIIHDLDMHSLIITSVETQMGQNHSHTDNSSINDNNYKSLPIVVDADQVIEEIDALMSDRYGQVVGSNKKVKNRDSINDQTQHRSTKIDPLLSLNAASLLDAALQSWHHTGHPSNSFHYRQQHQLNPKSNVVKTNSGSKISLDDGEFHSLPADLNNDNDEDIDNFEQSSYNHSVVALKASNLVLNSKLIPNHNSTDLVNDGQSEAKNLSSADEQQNKELVEKLWRLSIMQLNEFFMELERIIQIRSEVLIQELAARDELEYEKELKNTFISLLLSVQNKRRHYMLKNSFSSKSSSISKKSKRSLLNRRNSNDNNKLNQSINQVNNGRISKSNLLGFMDLGSIGSSIKESLLTSTSLSSNHQTTNHPVYLTTVIPYDPESMNPLDLPKLQILIKLLNALNEDSSTVPSLLTDYILKVICP